MRSFKHHFLSGTFTFKISTTVLETKYITLRGALIKLVVNYSRRQEDSNEKKKERLRSSDLSMMKFLGEAKVKKTMLLRACRGRMKLWILRAIAILSLWTFLIQLVAVGDFRGAKLLKDWPSYVSSPDKHMEENKSFVQPKVHLPPKRSYKNNGHLLVSCNGGLNQMRAAICDMVAIAKYLNITLFVPELDKTSFWADSSDFKDIFDVDHFITSLRDEVQILKELPSKLKSRVDLGKFYELAPVSWSNISYYHKQILPLLKKYKVVHLNRTDARLANNRLPLEIQKLRCKVNFHSLRFTSQIEELGRKILRRLNGPFLVLHLRYEMDMLSFSGCTRGCNTEEVNELTTMRFANSWWKEKVIDPELKRKEGLCPLTPEETALVLTALSIDSNTQVYIASGEIYGGTRRLRSLKAAFPNLVNKETLLEASDLKFLKNHSSQMAALDYFVSLESDVFVPTYDGNMAKLVEGHRRYLGFKKTILLNRRVLVGLIDRYNDGSLRWDEFSAYVREAHSEDRAGSPKKRVAMENRPKEEDYFYANPEECLPPLDKTPRSL